MSFKGAVHHKTIARPNTPWFVKDIGQSALLPYGEREEGGEYASWCTCVADRYLGHLSRTNIVAAKCDTNRTSPSFQLCPCSPQASADAFRDYTGMMTSIVPMFPVPVDPGVCPGGPPVLFGHWTLVLSPSRRPVCFRNACHR